MFNRYETSCVPAAPGVRGLLQSAPPRDRPPLQRRRRGDVHGVAAGRRRLRYQGVRRGRRAMKPLARRVAGVGMVFPASAVKTRGRNWLGRTCARPRQCFHLESLVTGAVPKVTNRSFTCHFLQARVRNKVMRGVADPTALVGNGGARGTRVAGPRPAATNPPRRGR